MGENATSQSGALPSLFYEETGNLNLEFFERLWKETGFGIRRIKSLVKLTNVPDDDRAKIKAFAEQCEKVEWRRTWYSNYVLKKRGVPRSLAHLALSLAKQNDARLDIKEDSLSGFFKKSLDGRFYPRQDRLSEMAVLLTSFSNENLVATATFIWGLCERLQSASRMRNGAGTELKKYANGLLEELDKIASIELLALLSPPIKVPDAKLAKSLDRIEKPNEKPNSVAANDAEEKDKPPQNDEVIDSIRLQFKLLFAQIFKEAEAVQKTLIAIARDYQNIELLEGAAEKTRVKLDELREIVSAGDEKARILLERVRTRLSSLTVIRFEESWVSQPPLLTDGSALPTLEKKLAELYNLILLDKSLANFSSEILDRYQNQINQCYALDFKPALTQLREISSAASSYNESRIRWDSSLRYITAIAPSLEWDATTDPHMEEHWAAIVAHCLENHAECDFTWLFCRKALSVPSASVSELIVKKLESYADDWDSLGRKLSFLDPVQLEPIARSSESLCPSVLLVQVLGFLVAASQKDPDSFDFWSLWPLCQYMRDPTDISSPPLERLISAIYISSAEDEGVGVLKELREIGNEIKIDEGINDRASDTSLWNDLDVLLTYRPHGEGNYAALWKTAYKDCIEPLRLYVLANDIMETSSQLLAAVEDLDIEDRYFHWLRTLQHTVYSESQYEAATKVYVAGRLAKIKNWCEQNVVEQFIVHSEEHPIRDVLTTIEYESERARLKLWIDYIAKTFNAKMNALVAVRTDAQDGRYGAGIPADCNLPRSYLEQLAGVKVGWRKLVTDFVAQLAGCNTPERLWDLYKVAGCLEAQERLILSFPNLIGDSEKQSLYQEIHLSSIKLAVSISDVKRRLASFDVTAESSMQVRNMELAFEEKSWTQCSRIISSAQDLVSRLEKEAQLLEQRRSLIDGIRAFDEDVELHEETSALSMRYDALVQASSNRRLHIKVLRKFADTRNLSSALVDCALEQSERLSIPSALPIASESQFVAEVWESLLNPIADQLRRPQVLQAQYKRLLELLASEAIAAMPALLKDLSLGQSLIESWLDCATLMEDVGSAEDLKNVIKKFAIDADLSDLTEELETADVQSNSVEDSVALSDFVTSPRSDVSSSEQWELGDYRDLVSSWLVRHVSESTVFMGGYNDAMEGRDWIGGLALSLSSIEDLSSVQITVDSPERDAFLAAVICALNIPAALADTEASYALGLITACEKAGPVQWALNQKGKLGGAIIVDAIGTIILRWANKDAADVGTGKHDFRSQVGTAVRELSNLQIFTDVPRQEAVALFGKPELPGFPPGIAMKLLWDVFTGEKQQAEVRASLMLLLYKVGLYKHVGLCFTLSPIDIEKRVALAYAQLLEGADSSQDRESLENIRGASQSKPFVIFTQAVLASVTRNSGLPAEIEFSSPLERAPGRKEWMGILTITPRSINPPLDIELELPGDGTITFGNGRSKIKFSGPFFGVRDERVNLIINIPELSSTVIRVRCEFITLEEKRVIADINLSVKADSAVPFNPMSSEQLSKAFGDFPQFQMRGVEYVHRDEDEKRIETALFDHERAGSIWISSPRRSGKTTMLFRILDAYSHKVGRDNAIIFLSMDKGFQTVKDFNHWVWSRAQFNDENLELRSGIVDFARIGEQLPFASGADIFLTALAKEIISRSERLTRVYFLIDEIDKLSEMTLSGGIAKDVAVELTWQFRHIISSQPSIGMVFSGSNPARTMFVRNPQAALYNSIQNFDLIPFGTKTELQKKRAREIVEPAVLRGKYKLPDKTLEFLIKITAGIPYYMKLVAGATYAVSQQKYLMHSDVIQGLASLLDKSTGVTALDSLDDPGEDELRVLYTRDERDQLLVRAVLYSAAEIRSPISGGPLMNGELRSHRSPLVGRYNLSKSDINSGVESAIQLGYLKRHKELAALEFSIPMLGESIRHRSGALWAIINDKLEQLASV